MTKLFPNRKQIFKNRFRRLFVRIWLAVIDLMVNVSFFDRVFKRLNHIYVSRIRKKLLSSICDNHTVPKMFWHEISRETLCRNTFFYKDELWPEIVNLQQICRYACWGVVPPQVDRPPCANTRVLFSDDGFSVSSTELTPKRWVFLHRRDPLGESYVLEFSVKISSEFTELQFAFNMEHIMKRMRFMILDNKKLVFQVVGKGFFLKELRSIPCRLELEREYKVRIEVIENTYAYYLDEQCLMNISLTNYPTTEKSTCALIFYELSDFRPIVAEVSELKWFVPRIPSQGVCHSTEGGSKKEENRN